MLQIKFKRDDICRLSKLVTKYNINASITSHTITLEDNIPGELLCQLCNSMTTISTVQNFSDELTTKQENQIMPPQASQDYELIYSIVKRGEVYLCDFGEPYGSEQGGERYVIVVQNDLGNYYSPTTIVVPCTTEAKKNLPVHHEFHFVKENMKDYDTQRVGCEQNIVLGEQLRTVDKTRLRKYIGTMKPSFMNRIDKIIDISLALKRAKIHMD